MPLKSDLKIWFQLPLSTAALKIGTSRRLPLRQLRQLRRLRWLGRAQGARRLRIWRYSSTTASMRIAVAPSRTEIV